MNDYEYIEIRLYFIGPEGVGKKSLLSKFNTIPCSKEVLHKTELPIPKPTFPEVHKSPTGKTTSLPSNSPPPPTTIPLTTTTMQYELMRCLLGIKGYVMPITEDLNHPRFDAYDFENDKDYDLIKQYKISFNNTKRRLETLIMEDITDNTIAYETSIEHFFIFVFDLGDYNSFEAMLLYYNSLNKHFDLNSNYNKVVFGNKLEKKTPFNNDQQDVFERFMKETRMFYYEVATRPFFSFPKFFDIFFFDHMTTIRQEFQSPIIRNRFKSILFAKSNFSKSKRDLFGSIKQTPGPCSYNSVFDYGDEETFNEALTSAKKRHITKIFINKIGPIFNKAPLQSFIPEPPKQTEEQKMESKIHYKNMAYLKKPLGFSLGIKPGILNLRKIKKDKKIQRNSEIRDSFQVNMSNLINKTKIQEEGFKGKNDNYFNDVNNNKEQYQQRLKRERSARNVEYMRLHKENEKTIQRQQSALTYKSEYHKIRKKHISHEDNSRHLIELAEKNLVGKRPKIITPGPDYYDIRGSLANKNKGFSLIGKRKGISQSQIMSVPFADIQSEFDILVQKAKQKKVVSSYEERFPVKKLKYQQVKMNIKMKELDEKLERWNENRYDNEVSNKLQWFFEKRYRRKNEQMTQKIENEKSRQESDEEKYSKRRRGHLDPRKYYPVKFDLIEERSPSYSMKGRQVEKKSDWNDLNDLEGDTIDKSLNYIGNKLSQATYPVPQVNYIKPSLVAYSFPKQERFSIDRNQGNMQRAMSALFLNGNYSQSEHIEFSNKEQFKVQKSRFHQSPLPKSPGPCDYPIKCFSDHIVEKGTQVNSIRFKVRSNPANLMENKLKIYMKNDNNLFERRYDNIV